MEEILQWLSGLWRLGELSLQEEPVTPGSGKLSLLGAGREKAFRDILGGGGSRHIQKYALQVVVSPVQERAFGDFLLSLEGFPFPKESYDRAFAVSDVALVKQTSSQNRLYRLTFTATYSI